MKIKKILPVLFTATFLAGCNTSGGVSAPKLKAYKNKVEYTDFVTKYTALEADAAYKKDDLIGSYDLNAKATMSSNKTTQVAHSGKKFVTNYVLNGKAKVQFDQNNSLLLFSTHNDINSVEEKYSISDGKVENTKENGKADSDIMYQVNEGTLVNACENTQTYSEMTTVTDEGKAKFFDGLAKTYAKGYTFSMFEGFITYNEDSKEKYEYYVDDNVLTFVFADETTDSDEISDTSSKHVTKVQIEVKDDEFIGKVDQTTESKEVFKANGGSNYAGDVVEEKTAYYIDLSLKYKNVSLKAFDLSKYICTNSLA